MDIQNAHYTEGGEISAVIDGLQMSIPDSVGNRHRKLLAEWEAEGNTIASAPAPPTQAELDQAEIDEVVTRLQKDRTIDKTMGKAIFILLGRIETLENTVNGTTKTPTTWAQFVNWFKAQINA